MYKTDASELGFGGILSQIINNKETIVRYYFRIWKTTAQKNYPTIKKEILSIVLCLSKFQDDLLNEKFLLKIDCRAAKDVLTKDVKNLVSKQIFARWQALLSVFDFDIEYIKGAHNHIPDYLTREFLQGCQNQVKNQT